MEVENRSIQDDRFLYNRAIFHFHDYGREGSAKRENHIENTNNKWMFPKIVVAQNGWFIMENPIKIDDLGVPLFLETPKCNLDILDN